MRTVLVLAALAGGCSDQCRDGESICDGTTPMLCALPDDGLANTRDFREQGENCATHPGDRCVDTMDGGDRVAVCSTSGAPDPRCDGAPPTPFCADPTTALYCSEGYSAETDCGGTCATGPYGAFCSTETAPNLACTGVYDLAPVCDGASIIHCYQNYVVDRIPCAEACITSHQGQPFCTDGTSCSNPDGAMCDSPTATALHGCISGETVAATCNFGSTCDNITTLPDFIVEAQCTPRDF